MRRGDLVLCALSNDYGKVRPAVVIQADLFIDAGFDSVTLCPLTTALVDAPLFRIPIAPSARNGLDAASQAMVDKVCAVKSTRIRQIVGALEVDALMRIDEALRRWQGLG